MTPRGRHFVTRGSKRQTTWVGPADQDYVLVASGAVAINQSFDPVAAGMNKPTITRVRGLVSITPASGAADVEINGAWGFAVVSDQAFAAGAASIPGPYDEAGWDGWFAWGAFSMKLDVTSDIGRLSPFGKSWEIDSRGQRKVSDNETIVVMVESNLGAVEIAIVHRMLLKLA